MLAGIKLLEVQKSSPLICKAEGDSGFSPSFRWGASILNFSNPANMLRSGLRLFLNRYVAQFKDRVMFTVVYLRHNTSCRLYRRELIG